MTPRRTPREIQIGATIADEFLRLTGSKGTHTPPLWKFELDISNAYELPWYMQNEILGHVSAIHSERVQAKYIKTDT
jgi:hypothetical protein